MMIELQSFMKMRMVDNIGANEVVDFELFVEFDGMELAVGFVFAALVGKRNPGGQTVLAGTGIDGDGMLEVGGQGVRLGEGGGRLDGGLLDVHWQWIWGGFKRYNYL
jgi:hypothetical protein